jgi:hypothetical protein
VGCASLALRWGFSSVRDLERKDGSLVTIADLSPARVEEEIVEAGR